MIKYNYYIRCHKKGADIMFKNISRENADRMISVQTLALFSVSLVTLILGFVGLALKNNGALNTVSVIFAVITIILSAALIGYVIMTNNLSEKPVAGITVMAEAAAVENTPVAEEHVMEEETIVLVDNVDEEALAEAIAEPTVELDAINFIDEEDEEDEAGVEVISVVWPERAHKSKIYRYNPSGQRFKVGDHVLVPTRDVASNKDIIRKATVAHANHKMDPEHLRYPLKNIIGIVKAKEEDHV